MPTSPLVNLVEKIRNRRLDDGGFSELEHGTYRPDSTSWAIIALQAAGVDPEIIWSAQSRLIRSQMKDGRIPISPEHPESFWPTPLAMLAWHKSDRFKQATLLASQFLLDVKGIHFEKEKDSPMGHDTSIQGWPWVEETHSWVEPTCLSVLALQAVGFGSHKRVEEAIRMILDRQLPAGGWNLGKYNCFWKRTSCFS